MPRSSPPKHRHDGTSPLPLGMDWSPPPRKWEGRNTIWPHDSRTGWSYCVMIPSWMVETGSGASSDSLLNPIIFYRIQIGIQSPEGISSSHDVLRRFSDFLKLFYALKKVYPKKDIPPAPPKRALLRINSSRLLLEERRRALEEWTGKLLADINLSRSAHIATFLDLEAAARSSFEDTNVVTLKASTSGDALPSLPRRSRSSVSAECSSVASKPHSPASDVSIDTGSNKFGAGEASNGTMGMAAFFDQPKEFPNGNLPRSKGSSSFGGDSSYKNSSKQMLHLRDIGDTTTNQNQEKLSFHSRRLSAESIGSDTSSIRTVDFLPGVTSSFWDGSSDFSGGAVFPTNLEASSNPEKHFANDVQILISIDQQQKLNRVLFTMERRLVTARTDMEDIITRLNQEMTVKEYLTTKVKDLEAELELTKHRYKENLQQAILLERERFTQTQWDMDELRRKCLELELKFKLEQGEKIRVELESTTSGEKEILLQELSVKQDQIVNLERHLEQLELKSKADIKVLVKEVKLLRNSQEELKKMLSRSTKEKDDIERVLQEEREGCAMANCRRKELLRECESLRSQLKECSVNFLSAEKDGFTVNQQSLNDALGLLETSDNRIGLLIAETRLLVEEDEGERADPMNADDSNVGDDETRNMLIGVLTDNARLRKQLNSVFRCALEALFKAADGKGGGEGETPSQKTIMNRLLWR